MKTHTIVPVEAYLSTVYRPDCDYVDGGVEERKVGENDHAYRQREILFYLRTRERDLGVYVIQEQRVQIGPARFWFLTSLSCSGEGPPNPFSPHHP